MDHRLSTSTNKLLREFSRLMRKMKQEGILRSNNNPAADLGERVACEYFDLTPAPRNTKGYDAEDAQGLRYEIKSRRSAKVRGTKLGALRDIKRRPPPFDVLVFVIFNDDFTVQCIGKVPIEKLRRAKFDKHTHSYRVTLTKKLLEDANAANHSS